MGVCDGGSPHQRYGLFIHEPALFIVGFGTLVSLAARAGPTNWLTYEVGAVTVAFAAAVLLLRHDAPLAQKARIGATYAFVVWFYFSVQRFVPALSVPLRDAELRNADNALFGCLPAAAIQEYSMPWLTDLLSLCYLSYIVYLNVVLIHALCRPASETLQLGAYLFNAYAIGLTGYLLVPAVGPEAAFPEMFTVPLRGGLLRALNAAVVARGSSLYDVFPSLHVLVTCVLLNHDRRYAVRRFRLMLLPAMGMVVATVYLRYHYVVDLLAGVACFLAVRAAVAKCLLRSPAADALRLVSGSCYSGSLKSEPQEGRFPLSP
jgi:hypothetical protein